MGAHRNVSMASAVPSDRKGGEMFAKCGEGGFVRPPPQSTIAGTSCSVSSLLRPPTSRLSRSVG